jgi:ATP-binding cassette subfamily B protein
MNKPWDMGRQMGGIGKAVGLRHAFDEPEPPKSPPPDRTLLRRVLACFQPYRGLAALMVATILVTTLLGLAPPLLVRGLIDTGIPNGQAAESALPLLPYVLGLVLVPLAAGIVGMAQQFLSVRLGQGILCDLRNRLFGHLRNHSLRYYTVTRSGEIVARVWDDVAAVESAVSGTMIEILTNTVTVVGTLIVLFVVSWPLALAACATLPIFLIPARRVGRWRRQLVGETQQKQAELLGML